MTVHYVNPKDRLKLSRNFHSQNARVSYYINKNRSKREVDCQYHIAQEFLLKVIYITIVGCFFNVDHINLTVLTKGVKDIYAKN